MKSLPLLVVSPALVFAGQLTLSSWLPMQTDRPDEHMPAPAVPSVVFALAATSGVSVSSVAFYHPFATPIRDQTLDREYDPDPLVVSLYTQV